MQKLSSDDQRTLAERLLVASREAHWAFPTLSGRPVTEDTPAWAERLVNERSELAGAAAWFMHHGERDSATELAANAWRVWVLARDDASGRAFLASVLDASGTSAPTRFRALALYGDGLLAFRLGALADSRARNDAALEAARLAKDREAEGLAHLGLSRVDLFDGRWAEARAHARAAHSLLRGFEAAYGQAPLNMLAQATRLMGLLDEAAAHFEDSLALNRELGHERMVVVELHNLGHVELGRGNVERAARCFEEAVVLTGDTTDPHDLAMRSFGDAAIAAARGDTARAAALLREARAFSRATGLRFGRRT